MRVPPPSCSQVTPTGRPSPSSNRPSPPSQVLGNGNLHHRRPLRMLANPVATEWLSAAAVSDGHGCSSNCPEPRAASRSPRPHPGPRRTDPAPARRTPRRVRRSRQGHARYLQTHGLVIHGLPGRLRAPPEIRHRPKPHPNPRPDKPTRPYRPFPAEACHRPHCRQGSPCAKVVVPTAGSTIPKATPCPPPPAPCAAADTPLPPTAQKTALSGPQHYRSARMACAFFSRRQP
jgi:hypothetical protein